MLIFLAESKTMRAEQQPVAPSQFSEKSPLLETMADKLMADFSSFSPYEISERLGISLPLAIKSRSLAYEFANKSIGSQALYTFTGEAFRGLQATSLSPEAKEIADTSLRFISSAYGILSPSSIIKPYRLEYNKKCAPEDKTPVQYFKSKVTIAVVNQIKTDGVKDIINLLPADAEMMLDWKIIRAFAKVHKICFRSMLPDGKLRTPSSQRLKELRGLMCRMILQNSIQSFSSLISQESPHFAYSPDDSRPLLPVFIAD